MAEHICTAEKLKYKRRDGSLGALRALTPGSERRGSALETSSRMFIGTIRELKSGIPRARRIRDYGGRDERCASETPREDSPGKGEQIKLEITYIRLNYHSPTFPLSLFRSFSCTALTAQHHISPLALFFLLYTLSVLIIYQEKTNASSQGIDLASYHYRTRGEPHPPPASAWATLSSDVS